MRAMVIFVYVCCFGKRSLSKPVSWQGSHVVAAMAGFGTAFILADLSLLIKGYMFLIDPPWSDSCILYRWPDSPLLCLGLCVPFTAICNMVTEAMRNSNQSVETRILGRQAYDYKLFCNLIYLLGAMMTLLPLGWMDRGGSNRPVSWRGSTSSCLQPGVCEGESSAKTKIADLLFSARNCCLNPKYRTFKHTVANENFCDKCPQSSNSTGQKQKRSEGLQRLRTRSVVGRSLTAHGMPTRKFRIQRRPKSSNSNGKKWKRFEGHNVDEHDVWLARIPSASSLWFSGEAAIGLCGSASVERNTSFT
nr:hypothetical protein [Tanacetum cinerariifolium]